jgi:hypothetical protein
MANQKAVLAAWKMVYSVDELSSSHVLSQSSPLGTKYFWLLHPKI